MTVIDQQRGRAVSTGTEVAVRAPQGRASGLPAKVHYARALAESGLLPRHYQQHPANILWAMEFGEMLGLSPMAAITGVHVIEGKPTASAGLISALVRRAGHKLRVKGDSKSATCQIVRADDPDYTFEVTFTIEDAEAAKLTGKPVWKQYASSMLKARAITQCARDACEEALFGLHYTPEELGAEVDEDGGVVGGTVVDEPAQPAQQMADRSAGTPQDDPWYVRPSPEQEWLAKALEAAPGHASLDACGAAWTRVVEYVNDGKLTKDEGARLQDALRARIAELKAAAGPAGETPSEAEMVEGVIVPAALDPDDPWASAVEALATSEDAAILLGDLLDQFDRDEIDAERAGLVEDAILARFPDVNKESQVAA